MKNKGDERRSGSQSNMQVAKQEKSARRISEGYCTDDTHVVRELHWSQSTECLVDSGNEGDSILEFCMR